MPAIFIPPIVLANPPVLPDTRGVQYRLFRYLGPQPVGRSVVKVAGVYTTVQTPDQLTLAGLTDGVDYFLGGHEYVVSDAVAAALVTDGYGSAVNTVQWSELTGSWESYSSDPWGVIG